MFSIKIKQMDLQGGEEWHYIATSEFKVYKPKDGDLVITYNAVGVPVSAPSRSETSTECGASGMCPSVDVPETTSVQGEAKPYGASSMRPVLAHTADSKTSTSTGTVRVKSGRGEVFIENSSGQTIYVYRP